MIINMLEAISEMLKDTKEVEVKCAKTMLDKVIEGMKNKNNPQVVLEQFSTLDNLQKKQVPVKVKNNDVRIVVDGGKVTSVENAKDDTQIELDGVVYPWKETIGKTFFHGRIL